MLLPKEKPITNIDEPSRTENQTKIKKKNDLSTTVLKINGKTNR